MSQRLMKSDARGISPKNLHDDAKKFVGLIQIKLKDDDAKDKGAIELSPKDRFADFRSRIAAKSKALGVHGKRAKEAIDSVLTELQVSKDKCDWATLAKSIVPRQDYKSSRDTEFTLGGVTVWEEGREPWRPVDCLIVLGFEESRYPGPMPASPVFFEEDWTEISLELGISVERPQEQWARTLDQLHRQICAVGKSVTFLQPYRLKDGKVTRSSDSVHYMARLFDVKDWRAGLVLDLDRRAERKQLSYVASARECEAPKPKVFESSKPAIRLANSPIKDLEPTWHTSPSKLERMLVSPLAWTLQHLGALPPKPWHPREATPIVLGNLAHAVFESIFGNWQENRDNLSSAIDRALSSETKALYPFLLSPEFQIEYGAFLATIKKSILHWHASLKHLQAEVVGIETELKGTWLGVNLKGKLDLVLAIRGSSDLPQGVGEKPMRGLIVDFKRSASTDRIKQMEEGFELQLSAYRELLRQSENVWSEHGKAPPEEVDLAYFTLSDRVTVSDSPVKPFTAIPIWRRVVGDGVSRHAETMIEDTWGELKEGIVRLNHSYESENKTWKQGRGIPLHALEDSPLIRLFATHQGKSAKVS